MKTMQRTARTRRQGLLGVLAVALLSCQSERARPPGPSPTADRAGATADPDLAGYWPFDEGQGATAANVVGTNAGKVQAGLTWVDGKKGKALLFNGADHVVIPHANYFNAPRV
jgi:hypothetical protein